LVADISEQANQAPSEAKCLVPHWRLLHGLPCAVQQWTILGWSRIHSDSKARWGQWRSVAEISEQANQAPRILSSFVPHGPAALHAMRRAAVGDFGLELIEFDSKVRPQAIN